MTGVAFERLERVAYERREWHPVGETADQMRACMEWVRSLGHEAKSLEEDGFRYRSVYATASEYTGRTTSGWHWCEPGEWLMHMSGDRQDPELDSPHADGPEEDGFWPHAHEWHQVSTTGGDR